MAAEGGEDETMEPMSLCTVYEGGGVERSRTGDNKDKLVEDVSGEMEGSIRVVSGGSKC